jgi:hypothetical protein
MKLVDCLAAQTWRALQAVSRANGLGFDANLTKQQAVQRLASWLGSDEHLPGLAGLSPDARAALRELLAAGGQMGYETFVERFGPIRSYRPWQPEAARSPWAEPQSAAEMLVYRGWVFPITLGRTRHCHRAIVLPDEFHEPAMARLSPALCVALDVPPSWPTPSLPVDLLTFLAYLQRRDVRPIWKRWLPLAALRILNQLLISPDDLGDVRSERQARRIPFLHYLAEAANLIALTAGTLKPTLVAHQWLARPLADRIAALWNAWRQVTQNNDARWTVFRMPTASAPNPTDRFGRLCRALASFPANYALPAEDWPAALNEIEPTLFRPTPIYDHWLDLSADEQAGWTKALTTALSDLLIGPLTWFGVFAPNEEGHRLAFTPLGAALVGRSDSA